MMTNLFNSFDPTANFNLKFNWLSTISTILFLPMSFWLIPSRWNFFWMKFFFIIHNEFKIIVKNKFQGMTLIFISLLTFIMLNNFIGLFPYIFTSTSHMIFTLTMALPLWFSFMLFGWINNTTYMLAHLVPQGTPPILMPFMVMIESISNFIRPGTLAIRLTANMIAGHLLLTLLGNTGPSMSILLMNLLIITQILLLILESAVAVIQSYVFAILSTLYSSEVI